MVLNDFCVLQTLPEDNLDYHSRSNVSYVQMFGEISQNFNFSKINERMHFKTIPEIRNIGMLSLVVLLITLRGFLTALPNQQGIFQS